MKVFRTLFVQSKAVLLILSQFNILCNSLVKHYYTKNNNLPIIYRLCVIIIVIIFINVKNKVYRNGYRRRSCTSKTAKIHRFVRFVMYCFITTVRVAFYCARSDEIVHYKCDETGEFLRF